MNLKNRIDALVELGVVLKNGSETLNETKAKAYAENQWFTIENIDKALHAIASEFLDREKLHNWTSKYDIKDGQSPKKVGLILAGNIPLVGFHDLLSVFVSGHTCVLKLSSKDYVLMKYAIDELIKIEPKIKEKIIITERINDIDAMIATGSNNTYRYFEYYFGKYPNILRKNRNGVAVISGDESEEDYNRLASDIFEYFGLGCRNVAKIYVPERYEFQRLLSVLDEHKYLKEHNKYMNNYDYNLAVSMLNKDNIYQGETVFLKEDMSYLSRIASVNFEYYSDIDMLNKRLKPDDELIQVISTKTGNLLDFDREVMFGDTQKPSLEDYADGVDTMQFLTL